MNIFRNTKWTLQARKKQITRAKRHKLRLHLERLDTRVQASSSLLGAVWGVLIADAFGRDGEENPLAQPFIASKCRPRKTQGFANRNSRFKWLTVTGTVENPRVPEC